MTGPESTRRAVRDIILHMRTSVLGLVVILCVGGCGVQAREARAVQPNPLDLARSPDVLPVSQRLFIYQRDLNLPRDYQLRNWAQFAVVSRDRLRFHVGVVRLEESDADTRSWKAWLEDDSGRRLEPDARESGRVIRIAVNWGLYRYRPGDSWCRNPPCLRSLTDTGSPGQSPYTAYEGRADFVFYGAGLARASKRLTLHLQRDGVEYQYTWRFADGFLVEHYGRTKVDDELGIIAVPGPYTDYVATISEEDL